MNSFQVFILSGKLLYMLQTFNIKYLTITNKQHKIQ